ncbi:SusF/SusE family outer membrane protein [Hoylesella oralis]|uniref:SusF/SusE family outer membrane protein n=1 Tax=Hoylesella oralis TaxID=28134 RepID=UPI0036066018
MKKIFQLMVMVLLIYGCVDNDISFNPQINVPEGVYLSGSATEFSRAIAKGSLKQRTDSNVVSLNAWLKSGGNFVVSFVGTDGQPIVFGNGGDVESVGQNVKTYMLKQGAEGFTVDREGLYKIVVNKQLNEVNVIPIQFKMLGIIELTDAGDKTIMLDKVSYDRINHIVTWCNADSQQVILPAEYTFTYTDGSPIYIKVSKTKKDTINTTFTGIGKSVRTNMLTNTYSELTDNSSVNLKLKQKGRYSVCVQYNVLTEKFSARIGGESIIEPEATGFPETLYMAGDNFGAWNTSDIVKMTPIGVAGNGVFWSIKYLTNGKFVQWSTSTNGADSFSSLKSNQGVEIDAQGRATVQKSSYYLIFVDMNRKLISFETPEVYGIGDCFGGNEYQFALADNKFTAKTSAKGNLKMFAVSKYNDRDWNSMEFNIYNGKIVYRGIDTSEMSPVPVASSTPIELNMADNTANFGPLTPEKDVPGSAACIYMIGDDFGNMNWASPEVQEFDRSYSEDYRWFYINYFKAGSGLRFSTGKCFGNGEFVSLKVNDGFTVQKDRAVVPTDGIYMVYIDLLLRMVSIEKVKLYGYCGSDRFDFQVDADGKTMTATIPSTGRVRMYPKIAAFSKVNKFSEWKREIYVDPATGVLAFRKPDSPEPNKDYVWAAGTKITLDFLHKKGIIVKP